jgi:hypothetical protein
MNLLAIGGIQIFLPFAQGDVKICVADVEAVTAEAGQPVETFREVVEHTLEAAQEGEDEHSKECLNAFNQEAKEAATLKLAAEEAEEKVEKMITPWERELDMMEDWLNNSEPIDEFHEEKIMHIVGEENSTKLLRNFSQEDEQEMTAALKPAT